MEEELCGCPFNGEDGELHECNRAKGHKNKCWFVIRLDVGQNIIHPMKMNMPLTGHCNKKGVPVKMIDMKYHECSGCRDETICYLESDFDMNR